MADLYPAVRMSDCPHCTVLYAFRGSIIGLHLDDNGLTDNRLDTLDRIAGLTYAVLTITRDAATPHDLLANRLARLTQQLIRARLMGGDGRQIVRDYLMARAELIELQANVSPRNGG